MTNSKFSVKAAAALLAALGAAVVMTLAPAPAKAFAYNEAPVGEAEQEEGSEDPENKIDISEAIVVLSKSTYTYSGLEIRPEVTVVFEDAPLTPYEDYEVVYENNLNAGEAKVTVLGAGRYEGQIERTFLIRQNDLADNRASIPYQNYTYSGKAITPAPTLKINGIKLVEGTDYTVSYSDNVNVGSLTAKITITGMGNFKGTTVRYFNIKPNDLADNRATIPYLNYTYTGKERTPEPTLKVGGIKLVKGTDYTVSYSNNINVGELTAKVTIKGKGNFTGTTVRYFNIKPNDLADNRATIPSLTYPFLGSSVKPVPTLKVNGIKLQSGKDYVLSYKNNSKIGTATVTLTGKGNFTGKTSREFEITKAHGFFVINGSTHYFDINGKEAKNCWTQGYQFDKNGAMTAESEAFKAKIDKYANDMLVKYGAENETRFNKLMTLFYHFEKSGYYYQKLANPNFSDPRWEMDAAEYMMKYRKGNCQRYSAMFAYLARAVGYDAVAQYHYYIVSISGTANWIHAWTEVIDDNGKVYICDSELRIEIVRFGTSGPAPFMMEKKATGNKGPKKMMYYYKWAFN